MISDNAQEGESEDMELIDPVLQERTLSAEELGTVQDVVNSVRLAAMITDTPANIMTIDAFIEVRLLTIYTSPFELLHTWIFGCVNTIYNNTVILL